MRRKNGNLMKLNGKQMKLKSFNIEFAVKGKQERDMLYIFRKNKKQLK